LQPLKKIVSTKILLLLLIAFNCVQAQQTTNTNKLRCGTMEALELYFKSDPKARLRAEQNANLFPPSSIQRTHQTGQTPMVIPVVVHLVLNAADMAKVTDADVQAQINQLNIDFSGNNSDSINAPDFYNVRGRSNITFTLAKQDPNGNATNGIDRVVSTISNFGFANLSQIKHGSSCGADAWDTKRYLNVWVGKSTFLVGISTFPGIGADNEQGITLSLDGFGNNPAYVSPIYNVGRTLVHETGHFLGLYHIWGDDDGCTSSDFRQLPGSCLIAGSDIVGGNSDQNVGDTPNQGASTAGCPTGVQTSTCSTATTGIQYQNFMDYTNDACYSMFTKLQVKRMEYMLANCRSSLLLSNGGVAPTQFALDATMKAILNPGYGNCNTVAKSNFCLGNTISPVVQIKNVGTSTLTSLKVLVQSDSNTPIVYSWSGSLPSMEITTLNLPAFTASVKGTHTLTIYTAEPNGSADQKPANDTLRTIYTVTPIVPLTRVEEGFNTSTFPPADWQLNNPDGDFTWEYNATVGKKRPGSAWFNDWNNSTNHRIDDLVTPNFSYSNIDSVFVHFQVANVMYSDVNTTDPIDTLSVLLSKDCGNTFTTIYKKWGADLQTVTNWPQNDEFYPRTQQDWRKDSVNLGNYLGSTEEKFQLLFRFHGNYENNIFLDDINIYTVNVPVLLKQRGLLIAPTITRNQFGVWHYQQPTDLRSVSVYNSLGQLIWQRSYRNNADKYIAVNLQGQSAGIYTVHLQYENARQNVTQRIVKQ
jgi:hypothetical protein